MGIRHLILQIAALACGLTASAFGIDNPVMGHRYEHWWVSAEECEKFRRENPLFHCTAEIHFIQETEAVVRFTDIARRAYYRVEGDRIRMEFDRRTEYRLNIQAAGRYLVDEAGRLFHQIP